ncbi:MAG: diaminopimelate decarboxylase, partial [Clostridia bacterium]|nr:diaminopimelate decarboxylase [Clostridia bacterium]
LNLGGGFGVRYTEADPVIDYRAKVGEVAGIINSCCAEFGIEVPKIMMEPGRSLVADSGITLYTVGSVKEVRNYKTYVSVDGGMTDNPRYTLYEAKYTAINASRADKKPDLTATLAGRCCESGDLIGEKMQFARPERGDILAVFTTGAYNYSMASNYNRVPRPAVVMLNSQRDYIAVRREKLEDIVMYDE